MSIHTLNNDKLTISYCRFGNPDGQPFVILPGLALKSVLESVKMIEQHYKLLADEYDVYLFDRRSDIPECYSIYDMADDTAAALDMLSLKNADIYGVSQGGMMAQIIAVERPDLVRRLALCSTASYIPETSAKTIGAWAEYAERKEVEKLVLSFAGDVYTKAYYEKFRGAFIEFGKTVNDEDLHRFVIMANSCNGYDVRSRLNEIKAPVLVIGAENDKLFSPEIASETAMLTGGELYIYENEAHSVYDENIDVVSRIKEFSDR